MYYLVELYEAYTFYSSSKNIYSIRNIDKKHVQYITNVLLYSIFKFINCCKSIFNNFINMYLIEGTSQVHCSLSRSLSLAYMCMCQGFVDFVKSVCVWLWIHIIVLFYCSIGVKVVISLLHFCCFCLNKTLLSSLYYSSLRSSGTSQQSSSWCCSSFCSLRKLVYFSTRPESVAMVMEIYTHTHTNKIPIETYKKHQPSITAHMTVGQQMKLTKFTWLLGPRKYIRSYCRVKTGGQVEERKEGRKKTNYKYFY